MPYRIVFTPEAADQIVSRYDYIVADGSPLIAERYTRAIVNYCEELNTFPHRGNTPRRFPTGIAHHPLQETHHHRLYGE